MKKNKAKKKLIRAYSIIALMVLSTLAWNVVNSAGHGVTITKPVNNSVYNNLYNKARVTTEKTALTFDFTIDNHDGYLIAYSAWIDEVADPKLNAPNWDPSLVLAHYVIPYDAQQFLDNYGQGSHTFTVAIYHGTPYVRPPFGLQEGDNPDDDDIYWVGNQGYLLSLVDEVSVTFTFDPVVVHYIGFWYQDSNQSLENNILAFHNLLWSDNAHYLHGFSYVSGTWGPSSPSAEMLSLSNLENENDIDIIHFVSHGLSDGNIKTSDTGFFPPYYADSSVYNLKTDILEAKFDSHTIIAIVDCCYSGWFIGAQSSSDVTILCATNYVETCWGISGFNLLSAGTLENQLDKMGRDFSRALALGIYDGNSLSDAWDSLANYDYSDCFPSYYNHGHIYHDQQHPIHSEFPQTFGTLYLYVP